MDGNVIIAEDTEGKKIAVINSIRFAGKRSVKWDDVRDYLKVFVGKNYRIESTDDLTYFMPPCQCAMTKMERCTCMMLWT